MKLLGARPFAGMLALGAPEDAERRITFRLTEDGRKRLLLAIAHRIFRKSAAYKDLPKTGWEAYRD
jgi:hypothetical protein